MLPFRLETSIAKLFHETPTLKWPKNLPLQRGMALWNFFSNSFWFTYTSILKARGRFTKFPPKNETAWMVSWKSLLQILSRGAFCKVLPTKLKTNGFMKQAVSNDYRSIYTLIYIGRALCYFVKCFLLKWNRLNGLKKTASMRFQVGPFHETTPKIYFSAFFIPPNGILFNQ